MNATQSKKLPKFRIHKASAQAYVELSGRRYYLGRRDTPAAQQKYHSMVAEWLAAGRRPRINPHEITVKELISHYWVYASLAILFIPTKPCAPQVLKRRETIAQARTGVK